LRDSRLRLRNRHPAGRCRARCHAGRDAPVAAAPDDDFIEFLGGMMLEILHCGHFEEVGAA